MIIERLMLSICGQWPQFPDQLQDVAEQMPGNGDLGHLKRNDRGSRLSRV